MKYYLQKTAMVIAMTFTALISNAQLYNYTDATDGTPASVALNTTGTNLTRFKCEETTQCPTGFMSDKASKSDVFQLFRSAIHFTVTPDAGYAINVNSMSVEVRRNPLGPELMRLAYSPDGGATWFTNGTDFTFSYSVCDSMTTLAWDFDDFVTDGPVTFKLIMFGSAGVNGKVQVKNFIVEGGAEIADTDGDGYTFFTDCNDDDPAINPGATEVCNGVDDNCDGNTDEGVLNTFYADADGDGYGDAASTTEACEAPEGYVTDNTDCNDADASVNPGATEVCNGVDDNCDGNTDEGVLNTFYADADGDGYGDAASTTEACEAPEGYVTDNTDCNDADASVNPGATEVCNGVDDNCDGNIDEGVLTAFYPDADGDGYGDPTSVVEACEAPVGYVADNTDCNDGDASINPGAVEVCNGIDDNCDGIADDGIDLSIAISPDGIVDLCKPDGITLTATAGFDSYQWFKNGNILEGETGSTYFTNHIGHYQVIGYSGECASDSSVYTEIVVHESPSPNIFTPDGVDLCLVNPLRIKAGYDPGYTYVWYHDGEVIADSTDYKIYANATGEYYCMVTLDQCTETTPTVTIINGCRVAATADEFTIYPNPSSGTFTISMHIADATDEMVTVVMTDVAGRIIYSNSALLSGGEFLHTVQLNNNVAPGVYIISLQVSGQNLNKQIIINN